METKNKINYCHFSLDKFYRHTRGFNQSLLSEYLSLYVEYMETGKCSSISLAMQEYFDVRGIGEDFRFLYERTLGSIDKAKNAANSRWHKVTQEEKDNAQAMHEQCSSINQAHANINENININKKKKYGIYKHVLLKDKEFNKLEEMFGKSITLDKINELDEGIERKGYKYKSHYLAILNWHRNKKNSSSAINNRDFEGQKRGGVDDDLFNKKR